MSSAVSVVREFLNHGHQLKLKQNSETILSTLHGHSVRIQPHFTPTVLSSATLATSYIKNWIIRNQESINGGTIRRILGISDYKHAIWKYKLDQSSRKMQYSQVLKDMELEEHKLVTLLKFKAEDQDLKRNLNRLQDNMKHVRMSLKLMKDTVSGSLHPEAQLNLNENENSTNSFNSLNLNSSSSASAVASSKANEADQLKIRGLLIRIAGPRKGNRAMSWERSVGAVSVNSVDYVISEESKVQLPSKLGIFGLYLRIVYQKVSQSALTSKKNPSDLEFFNGISTFKPFKI